MGFWPDPRMWLDYSDFRYFSDGRDLFPNFRVVDSGSSFLYHVFCLYGYSQHFGKKKAIEKEV